MAGYATVADIEALMQEFSFSGSSQPTSDQVQSWIDDYALEIDAVLNKLGVVTPVDEGASPKAHQFLANMNAMAAGARAEDAAGAATSEGSTRSKDLMAEYKRLLKRLEDGALVLPDWVTVPGDGGVFEPKSRPHSHLDDSTLALEDEDTDADFRIDRAGVQF